MNKPNLSVRLGSLTLRNPVMPASGCFGFGQEYAQYMDLNKLGAIVVKSVTLKETLGNKPPRVCETPAGMLNSIAWQNPGLDVFLQEKLPFLRQFDTPVIVNLAGTQEHEYGELAARLDAVPGIHGLEVNISCPNVEKGGVAFGVDPAAAARIIRDVRAKTSLPVIAKLSPNVTDIAMMAEVVEDAGADCISLINAFTAMKVDAKTRRPVLGNITGGLTGPAIKPIALYMTWRVAQRVQVPVIGIGGIRTAEDALEYLLVGATAVAVGMETFVNPTAIIEIISGLEQYLVENRIDDINQLVGGLLLD